MSGTVSDAGTARDAVFRIDGPAVLRIDGTDRASLCADPALDTRIGNRNKINVPEHCISPVRVTRLLPVWMAAGDWGFGKLRG